MSTQQKGKSINWAFRVGHWLNERNLLRFLPWRFLKAYVYPNTVRGSQSEFSDRITICPTIKPLHSRYHYNLVENSIIRALLRSQYRQNPAVFDLGSGAGHWIDFYLSVFNASNVYGLDIAKTCVAKLKSKYLHNKNVSIREGDISSKSFSLDQKFDIVNAIGVIFHIVDDKLWLQALINLKQLLNEDGIIVVGGQFGLITQIVQFHSSDQFDNLEDMHRSPSEGKIFYNKKIRSLRLWKRNVKKVGLRIKCVIRTPNEPEILTPENNVIVLENIRKTESLP